MAAKGPKHCRGQEALACVRLLPRLSGYTYVYGPTGSCTITGVRITLSATPQMPRWTKPAKVYPALLTWWRSVVKHIAWHEGQHIEIQKSWIKTLHKRIVGGSCSKVQATMNKWAKQVDKAQDAFDRRDSSWRYPAYRGPTG